MRLFRLAAAAIAIALFPAAADAAATSCPEHFAGGVAPDLKVDGMRAKARELCYIGFGTLHSGATRTPLYSASHLTRQRVKDGMYDERDDEFHEETRLPASERARLSDYAKSGYDRGHVAPNKDFPDPRQQYESFSLANMVPQVPEHNRNLWRRIEMATRDLALDRGEVYVVTGVMFTPDAKGQFDTLNGRVFIPSHMWKAVYDPRTGQGAAYLSPNSKAQTYEVVSIDQLTSRTGIDPFPAMAREARAVAMALPAPSADKRRGTKAANDNAGADAMAEALKALIRPRS